MRIQKVCAAVLGLVLVAGSVLTGCGSKKTAQIAPFSEATWETTESDLATLETGEEGESYPSMYYGQTHTYAKNYLDHDGTVKYMFDDKGALMGLAWTAVAESEEQYQDIYNKLKDSLKKKYGATVEDMIAYLEQCRSELDAMETADDTLILLNGKLKKAEAVVRAAGAELTQKRKTAAQALEQRIQSELRDLDMNKVRFAIEFTEKEPAADGCDVIRFLMSANAGEDLRPIAKVASGGELARIMLALKNVLAEQESIATLVFDEVDTGVSGRAAQKVAEKLTQVARHKQVLCVTHLPQLAAMADTHFSVEKGESGGRTFTRVIQLDREARKAELARITGGSQVTPALLESAGELLDQADAYRKQHFV